MDIIDNNPYRQLGIYSTSSQKEVVSNQGKMKAFLKVGRQVTFPLDLNGILPTISRTEESVAEAASKLSLPVDKLRYAQFWFAKCTQIDEIACAKLTSGDMNGAIDIWSKKQCASSLQNLLMCAIIKDEIRSAIIYAEALYSSYSEEFVKMILGDNALATSDNISHDFLDVLCKEFSPSQLLGWISNPTWKEYVSSKSIKPLVDKITTAIDTCKSSRGKGVTARYNAGTKLMNDTKADFAQLKTYTAANDLQYQMIADKLGLEILQCGIDYYNDSEAQDAAHKAMVLQKYALSVVVGQMAKDRCKENVDILQKIIADLPPLAIFADDRAIKEELGRFCKLPDLICHAVTLLNNTKPHLQSIKSKLGASNSYYLKLSTLVVGNALHNLIEEVNMVLRVSAEVIKSNPAYAFSVIDRFAVETDLSSTLKNAWAAINIIDTFDMEPDFEVNRYKQQRDSLKNLCEQLRVPTPGSYKPRSSPTGTKPPKTPKTPKTGRPTEGGTNTPRKSPNGGCMVSLICISGALGAVVVAIIGFIGLVI